MLTYLDAHPALHTGCHQRGCVSEHQCALEQSALRRVCGVTPFYVPRSNPDGFAVTLWCVDRSNIRSVDIRHFDGQNWEKFIESSSITAMSKE